MPLPETLSSSLVGVNTTMPYSTSHFALVALTTLALVNACGNSDSGSTGKSSSSGGQAGAPTGEAGAATNEGGAAGTSSRLAGVAGTAIVENPCGAADPSFGTLDSSGLFASAKIPTFDLYLPADAWASLQTNARDEVYVPAQACVDGTSIGLVGLRFKGSYGSLFNCFDSTGKNTCRKLGMKIKFDEYVEKQRFYGLDKLNFHGYHYDDSYIKEPLSYDLYRSMGIIAPRTNWALLRINGEARGLFGMVEEIDERFVKNRWPDNAKGNLFKEVWPGQTNEDWITSHLHTNESNPDISGLLAFSAALNAATGENRRSTLGNYVDLDYLARFMAVDDAIADFDGLTTFYTSGSDDSGNHNYYFYQESPNKFTIIPWDLESTLSLASNFGNVPYWQTTPADCSLRYLAWGGPLYVTAPGCDPVFRGLAADVASYRAAAQTLLDGPFSVETMAANIDKYANFIRAEATVDPHGPGATAFEKAVGFIKSDIPRLRLRLQHFVSGLTSVPLVLDMKAVNGFETADDYGINDGTTEMSNPATTMSVALNRTSPLSGTQSIRILFNFANETEPWQQWLFYTIPVASPPVDVSSYTGVRFKVRSDRARDLRINLKSPKNSRTNEGIDVGWYASITTSTETVSVKFANAKTPTWAPDPKDDLTAILQTVTGLSFMPQCSELDTGGQLPAGVTDNGWVDIDDVEFY
jgi:spore coat protein H